jgi:hypothetical protein
VIAFLFSVLGGFCFFILFNMCSGSDQGANKDQTHDNYINLGVYFHTSEQFLLSF